MSRSTFHLLTSFRVSPTLAVAARTIWTSDFIQTQRHVINIANSYNCSSTAMKSVLSHVRLRIFSSFNKQPRFILISLKNTTELVECWN